MIEGRIDSGAANPTGTEGRPTMQIKRAEMQQTIAKMLAEKQAHGTGPLDRRTLEEIPDFPISPYGFTAEFAAGFLPLPAKAESRRDSTWLIELQGMKRLAIGIHVLGDVVLGIARSLSASPDLDLSPYADDDMGVSRRHAVLRPTHNRLFVIDLQSTNGTRVNMMPVHPGIAMEVHNNDTISLGALTFTLKVIASAEQLAALHSSRTA